MEPSKPDPPNAVPEVLAVGMKGLPFYPAQHGIYDLFTTRMDKSHKCTLTIRGVSRMVDGFTLYSPPFPAGGIMWRMLVKVSATQTKDKKPATCMGFFTSCYPNSFATDWKVTARATLSLHSNDGSEHFMERVTEHEYTSKNNDWGYAQFASIAELHQKCIVDDVLRVSMGIELKTHEGFIPLNRYIGDLFTRSNAPIKRLREGYVDEAIAMNAEVLNESIGRNAYIIQKLQTQCQILNDVKLKQSIKRIERGGLFSVTNDRMTVKTALMGVPLPKHLSKKINMFSKNVRTDITSKIVTDEISEIPEEVLNIKKVAEMVKQCNNVNCACYKGSRNEKLQRSKKPTLSKVKIVKNHSCDSCISNDSTEEENLFDYFDSHILIPDIMYCSEVTIAHCGKELDDVENVTVKNMVLTKPENFAPPDEASNRKPIHLQFAEIGCYNDRCVDDLFGKVGEGKSALRVLTEKLLREYFTSIVTERNVLPFDEYIESVSQDALYQYDSIVKEIIEFFQRLTADITRYNQKLPWELYNGRQESYDCAMEVVQYIDSCANNIENIIQSQINVSDAHFNKPFTDMKAEETQLVQSLMNRTAEMKQIYNDGLEYLKNVKDEVAKVTKTGVTHKSVSETREAVSRRLHKFHSDYQQRQSLQKMGRCLLMVIEKQTSAYDTAKANSAALTTSYDKLLSEFKQMKDELEKAVKEKDGVMTMRNNELNTLRKQVNELTEEKLNIIEQMRQNDQQHNEDMRNLDKHKMALLCGVVLDEIENFLDDCDDGLRNRGFLWDASCNRFERIRLMNEMTTLRGYEVIGRNAFTVINQFHDSCQQMIDDGSIFDDLPDLPICDLPTVPGYSFATTYL